MTIRIAVPTPDGSWLLNCQIGLSPDCTRTFYSWDETEMMCAKCAVVQERMDKSAAEAKHDREALTPDDHPETGYLDMMTEEEKANAPWLSPDIRGRWV